MGKKRTGIFLWLAASLCLNVILVVLIVFFTLNTSLKPVSKELPEQFKIVNEAWAIINSDYVDSSEIDVTKISQGAVRGMIDGLGDRFSAYDDPESYQAELESFRGKFEGIGAYVGLNKDRAIVIMSPMDNSPAKEAGLKPGDIIIKIDDEETTGISVNEAATRIKGPSGTRVKLQIFREGVDLPFDVELIRREIKIQTVSYDVRDNIGYIKLSTFIATSDDDIYAAINELNQKGVEAFILDLQNNPGGLLETAVDIISQFQRGGTAVELRDKDGKTQNIPLRASRFATDLPLMILVNGGSASASEVVAGALQDSGRATLIGQETFGKGSAQVLRILSDGSAIRITNNRWLTPDGRLIDGVGLKPDVLSDLEDEELIKFAVDYLKSSLLP
ncbi:MAG TPA: S41 family peptidase [Dehalococcoidia bacterium]|nr:S41 family peptidase [Dehalococcoidia bacterium]